MKVAQRLIPAEVLERLKAQAQIELEPIENTEADARKAIQFLTQFIGRSQLGAVQQCLRGEESQFFIDKACELASMIEGMPKTYEQDGKADDAVVYLHYFYGSGDWYITEKDSDPADENGEKQGQIQAFGLADLGYGGELGYISIRELIENNVELDFYFEPKTLREVKQARH